LNAYEILIAASDNDAYNTLVCTDFAPEFGRTNVFQIGRATDGANHRDLPATLGGRPFATGAPFVDLAARLARGEVFSLTDAPSPTDLPIAQIQDNGVQIPPKDTDAQTLVLGPAT
ncbi:MAG: sodium:proton antiporter, partial [Pseudomonadota bacterium]